MRHCQVPETSQTAHTTGIERRRRRRRRRRNKRTTVAMKGEPLEGRGVVARGAGIVFLLFFVFCFFLVWCCRVLILERFYFGVPSTFFFTCPPPPPPSSCSSSSSSLASSALFFRVFFRGLDKRGRRPLNSHWRFGPYEVTVPEPPTSSFQNVEKRRKKSMIHLHPALEKRVFLPSLPSFTGFAVYLVLPSFHRQSIRRIKTVKATRN